MRARPRRPLFCAPSDAPPRGHAAAPRRAPATPRRRPRRAAPAPPRPRPRRPRPSRGPSARVPHGTRPRGAARCVPRSGQSAGRGRARAATQGTARDVPLCAQGDAKCGARAPSQEHTVETPLPLPPCTAPFEGPAAPCRRVSVPASSPPPLFGPCHVFGSRCASAMEPSAATARVSMSSLAPTDASIDGRRRDEGQG